MVLQSSINLSTWTNRTPVVSGDGSGFTQRHSLLLDPSADSSLYFRLRYNVP